MKLFKKYKKHLSLLLVQIVLQNIIFTMENNSRKRSIYEISNFTKNPVFFTRESSIEQIRKKPNLDFSNNENAIDKNRAVEVNILDVYSSSDEEEMSITLHFDSDQTNEKFNFLLSLINDNPQTELDNGIEERFNQIMVLIESIKSSELRNFMEKITLTPLTHLILLSENLDNENKKLLFNFLQEKKHVDLFTKDKYDATILHLAADQNNIEMIDFLLSKKPELINMQNEFGNSMLHIAGQNGFIETVQFLLNEEIDMNLQNCIGNTAEQTALEFEHKLCSRIIKFSNQVQEEIMDESQFNKLPDEIIEKIIFEEIEFLTKNNNMKFIKTIKKIWNDLLPVNKRFYTIISKPNFFRWIYENSKENIAAINGEITPFNMAVATHAWDIASYFLISKARFDSKLLPPAKDWSIINKVLRNQAPIKFLKLFLKKVKFSHKAISFIFGLILDYANNQLDEELNFFVNYNKEEQIEILKLFLELEQGKIDAIIEDEIIIFRDIEKDFEEHGIVELSSPNVEMVKVLLETFNLQNPEEELLELELENEL